jgi:hypothetical protein
MPMKDERKLKLLLLTSVTLTISILAYSILQEYVMPDIEGYLQRKNYYERTISKKGLSLHKGMYWKEKER